MLASHLSVTAPAHLYLCGQTLPCYMQIIAGWLTYMCCQAKGMNLVHPFTKHLPSTCLWVSVTFWGLGPSLDPAVRRPAGYWLRPDPTLWLPDPALQEAPVGLCPLQASQVL